MFSNNNAVLQACGVHKPFMQGIKDLLKKPGLSLPKVGILVGGPDWPTSVLAGVLGCSLFQCLIGTLPCFFQASFAVIAGAMLSRGKLAPYESMSGVAFSLAAIVNIGFGMLAT